MVVGPRATKEEFLRDLGLNWDRLEDKPKYSRMRDEAIAVYDRLSSDRNNLKDEHVNDPSIDHPWFWHHVRPEAQRWAIEEVWRNASPLTRPFYDRGATSGEHGPNAVTRWLLYSVFRSRDDRNDRSKRRQRDGGSRTGGSGGFSGSAGGRTSGGQQSSTSTRPGESRPYYDPARNGYVR